mmetsp:Transcript_27356/g.69005  ORF Transcript_27356/g.69005 Transcript_27356/m.69005 type:complete len:328 (+) Transcript_27356:50-1033(+)
MASASEYKEWVSSGRDGAGLSEEFGEEWSMMVIQDGGEAVAVEGKGHAIIHAPHAGGEGLATYIVANDSILEVRAAVQADKYACWFVGDYVQKNGSLILATPIDSLFLALPALEAARNKTAEHAGRFVPKEQIFVTDEGDEGLNAALNRCGMDLSIVCDKQDVGSDSYFRLNDDKVLEWLRAKVNAVIGHLHPGFDDSVPEGGWAPVTISEKAVEDKIASLEAAGLAKIAKERHVGAIAMVADYISASWLERLLSSYSLARTDLQVAKACTSAGSEQFRSFTSGKGESKDAAPTAKKPKVAPNKLAKVDTKGMSSMMSFFAKKPAPK